MDKKKSAILSWITAGIAILGVIILLVATIYSIMNLEYISDECSNFSGPKPYFMTAVIIASVAVGLQVLSIIMAITGKILNKMSNKNQERGAAV